MKISIKELKLCFNQILDKLIEDNVDTVELETDYYRLIPTNKWDNFDYDGAPIEHVGSLHDDIESLKKMINDPEIPCTYVDFDRLASVLRAISQENNPPIIHSNKRSVKGIV